MDRAPRFRNPGNFCLKKQESGEFLLVEAFESGIQPKVFGIPLTTGTRNKLSRNPESSTWSPKSTAWSPDSKTVTNNYMGRNQRLFLRTLERKAHFLLKKERASAS